MPKKTSLLFTDDTQEQITEICEAKDGLSRTKVMAIAIDRLHAAVCRPAPAAPTRSKHRTATKEK
jgi:hypothetical protein